MAKNIGIGSLFLLLIVAGFMSMRLIVIENKDLLQVTQYDLSNEERYFTRIKQSNLIKVRYK